MPATCLRIRSVPPITSLTSSMLRGHSGCARTTLPGLLRLARSRSDRKSTRLNSSHVSISYAVFCLKKKNLIRSCIFITAGLINTLCRCSHHAESFQPRHVLYYCDTLLVHTIARHDEFFLVLLPSSN